MLWYNPKSNIIAIEGVYSLSWIDCLSCDSWVTIGCDYPEDHDWIYLGEY